MTSEETLKTLSEAIDAYASAKVAGNESLVKFGIANLQQFLNGHVITPVEAPVADTEVDAA
jgi:hypothetical protein